MTTIAAPPDAVARVLDAQPEDQANMLRQLRALILTTAAETDGVGPLTDPLKWGEPAYLIEQSRSGSDLCAGGPIG